MKDTTSEARNGPRRPQDRRTGASPMVTYPDLRRSHREPQDSALVALSALLRNSPEEWLSGSAIERTEAYRRGVAAAKEAMRKAREDG